MIESCTVIFVVNLLAQCFFTIADQIVNDIIEKAKEVAEKTEVAPARADMADNAAPEGVKESEEVKQDAEGNSRTESAESAVPKEAEEEMKDENAPESGKYY